jgi:hypothetical protein
MLPYIERQLLSQFCAYEDIRTADPRTEIYRSHLHNPLERRQKSH